MSLTVNLGEEMGRDGLVMRCVRITHQTSLFEDTKGVCEIVEEQLLEFKGPGGELDFEVLSSSRKPYEGPPSAIKAPEPITWRREQ